jgi:hypothetical protein
MKEVIFISGAYRAKTINDTFANIMHARNAAIRLWSMNFIVICPHLNSFLMDGICDDSIWLEGDLEILKRCDAIYMLDGWEDSEGARKELGLAIKLGKKSYFEVDDNFGEYDD